MTRPPVRISLHVEWASGDADDLHGNPRDEWIDVLEIPRDEWEALTPQERVRIADSAAGEHAATYVAFGWHIDDADDYASTQGGPS